MHFSVSGQESLVKNPIVQVHSTALLCAALHYLALRIGAKTLYRYTDHLLGRMINLVFVCLRSPALWCIFEADLGTLFKHCCILANNNQTSERYKPREHSLYIALQYATEGRTKYMLSNAMLSVPNETILNS